MRGAEAGGERESFGKMRSAASKEEGKGRSGEVGLRCDGRAGLKGLPARSPRPASSQGEEAGVTREPRMARQGRGQTRWPVCRSPQPALAPAPGPAVLRAISGS